MIIKKNLFDPERGAGFTREAEASSKAFQRIRGMVLLGTAIIGNNRFAILQDAGSAPAKTGVAGQSAGALRIKLGDTVEGFRLSEIAEKKVVFTNGPSRVELVLDYFRRVEPRQPGVTPPGPIRGPSPVAPRAVPRVVPNLPRRQTAPADSDAVPNS